MNPPIVINSFPQAPIAVDTDDVDPFQHSFAEDHSKQTANPSESQLRSPSPTLSLQLELEPGQPLPQPQQQQWPESHIDGKSSAMKSSAELNMKSHVWRNEQIHDVEESSDEDEEVGLHKKFIAGRLTQDRAKEEGTGSHRRSDSLKRTSLTRSGSERGQGSSQLFPGSDFF
jgi:hypothetical protein